MLKIDRLCNCTSTTNILFNLLTNDLVVIVNNQNEITYKLNSKGQIDLEYYVDMGHQLRAEYLGQLFGDVKAWCGTRLNFHWLKGSFTRLAHH